MLPSWNQFDDSLRVQNFVLGQTEGKGRQRKGGEERRGEEEDLGINNLLGQKAGVRTVY